MRVGKALYLGGLYGPVRTCKRLWSALMEPLRDPYRPERHYMRGPGPKYRAKAMASAGGGR